MKYIIILCLSLLLGACATSTPINLSLQPTVYNMKMSHAITITDQRMNRSNMGNLGNRAIHINNLDAWMKYHFSMMLLNSCSSKNTPSIKVTLQKMYVDTDAGEIISAIVIKVRYYQHNHLRFTKIFRGQSSSVNWSGGADDAQHAFNEALQQILTAVSKNICKR